MANEQNLDELAVDLLGRAKREGVTEADVVVADGDNFSVQVRLSAVDRLTKAHEKRLGLRVFFGKRSASASTSDFSPESLDRLAKDACALAAATEVPDLDLYDSIDLDAEQQIELARRAEQAAMAADPRITNSEGADFNSASGRIVLANTHGFVGEYRSSSFSVSVSPIAKAEDADGMQRDYWYAAERKFARLASPESVGKEAARRERERRS